MTALAEKLKEAGADTLGAKLTIACLESLRRDPNPRAAWEHAFYLVGEDLIKGLMADIAPIKSPTQPAPSTPMSKIFHDLGMPKLSVPEVKPYQPRVIPPERLEKRRELQQIVRSKYKNSAGVSWSEVSWHELSALSRDGEEAKALIKAGPAMVPNNGCTVGEVLGVKETDAIIAAIRG